MMLPHSCVARMQMAGRTPYSIRVAVAAGSIYPNVALHSVVDVGAEDADWADVIGGSSPG